MRCTPVILLAFLLASCASTGGGDVVTISVVGTNDVHGELVPNGRYAGIVVFSGYVAALREARAGDGGVLLVDAGDMWQGTLESNLNEGAAVAAAYNAMGYAAAALGNHEFDFGPSGPKTIPAADGDDPRGALKARAGTLDFPLLAANLVDMTTGKPVDLPNLRSSTLVTVAGVRIGIVGVLTVETPSTTISSNFAGLAIAPLEPAVETEARALRAAGADLVVVVAHAGSRCEAFDDPGDLSSCNLDGEVMVLARQLPPGLVDHIVSGHKHNGIAHVVNGIAVTSAYSNAVAFDRVDFTFDRASGRLVDRHIFPPQALSTTARRYAGQPLRPMPRVAAIAEAAREAAADAKAEPLGPVLDAPLTRAGGVESGIGRLMTDAMLAESGADIAIYNVRGGIRADLAPGELTYGDVFQMSPFDNRLMVVSMRGGELRRVVEHQALSDDRRAGFAGMHVDVGCADGAVDVRMFRADGREIGDADELQVAINDFLALGGNDILTPVIPAAGIPIPDDAPLVRAALVDWFRHRGARLSARDYLDPDDARWNLPDRSIACAAL